MVDKPAGPTSHDIVDRVRRALGVRRVGHTGTLDPFATGVLPICVGKATRLARFLAEGDKVYEATVRLGFATTTDDVEGAPLADPRPVPGSREAVEQACARLVGELMQVPPVYSAKHVAGRRLYEWAREGTTAERRAAPVTVHDLTLRSFSGTDAAIEVRCSAGTYIRALARDLGELLGCGGHLVALRRTLSAGFGLQGAVAGDDLGPRAREKLLPLRDCLRSLPAVSVSGEGAQALRHGRDLTPALVTDGFPSGPPPPRLRVLDERGDLLALAVPEGFASQPADFPRLHADVVIAS